jgi:hypothetical protein
MTKLLEIYYPNLTKKRIRVGSGNEDERRSPAALHPKIAREFVTRTGKIGRLRWPPPRLRRSPTTDGRGGWRPMSYPSNKARRRRGPCCFGPTRGRRRCPARVPAALSRRRRGPARAGGFVGDDRRNLAQCAARCRRTRRRHCRHRHGQHHRQNGAGNAEQRQQLSALGLRPVRLHGGEKIGGLGADAPRLRLPENNRRKRHVLPTLQRCDALAQRLARPILV